MRFTLREMGPVRGVGQLLRLNQKKGFDCQSCAWPSPDEHRHMAEFCENGVKAVADEATTRRITREFFAAAFRRGTRRAIGPLARAPGPPDRADGPAPGRDPLRADHLGGRLYPRWRRSCTRWLRRTRRRSTPRAARATKPPFCTSFLSASSAPTTCPIARTCATNRAASR